MKDILMYKEYFASVHFNTEDEVFFGKIEGIDDLISFEGTTVSELKKSFENAVEDYIELCNEAGKKVEKTYKGNFNVRISPEIHKKAKVIAISEGISLNQLVQKALENEVRRKKVVFQKI